MPEGNRRTTDEMETEYSPPLPDNYYAPHATPYNLNDNYKLCNYVSHKYVPYDPNGKDSPFSRAHTQDDPTYDARMKENQESFRRFVRMIYAFLFK